MIGPRLKRTMLTLPNRNKFTMASLYVTHCTIHDSHGIRKNGTTNTPNATTPQNITGRIYEITFCILVLCLRLLMRETSGPILNLSFRTTFCIDLLRLLRTFIYLVANKCNCNGWNYTKCSTSGIEEHTLSRKYQNL